MEPSPPPEESFTISEAAQLTGLTKKAVRHRVDRGRLHAVMEDGVRRITRSELKRAGLDLGEGAQREGELLQALDASSAGAAREREQARQALEHAGREAHRLGIEIEQLRRELELARREELIARGRLRETEARAQAEIEAEREWRRRFARAGPIERRRLLRESERDDEVLFRVEQGEGAD